MKKIIVLACIFAVLTGVKAQDNGKASDKKSGFGIAIGASASTNGLGANVIVGITKWLSVRASYETLNTDMLKDYIPGSFPYSLSGMDVTITPSGQVGGISAMADLYLGRGLYVTGGLVQSAIDLSAKIMSANSMKIGDIEYTPEEIGMLEMNLKPGYLSTDPAGKFAPYLGVGLGRNIARNSGLAMSLEFGALMMKSYDVTLNGTGMFAGNSENASIQNLVNKLNTFSWAGIYPVVKLSISYKIIGK